MIRKVLKFFLNCQNLNEWSRFRNQESSPLIPWQSVAKTSQEENQKARRMTSQKVVRNTNPRHIRFKTQRSENQIIIMSQVLESLVRRQSWAQLGWAGCRDKVNVQISVAL